MVSIPFSSGLSFRCFYAKQECIIIKKRLNPFFIRSQFQMFFLNYFNLTNISQSQSLFHQVSVSDDTLTQPPPIIIQRLNPFFIRSQFQIKLICKGMAMTERVSIPFSSGLSFRCLFTNQLPRASDECLNPFFIRSQFQIFEVFYNLF